MAEAFEWNVSKRLLLHYLESFSDSITPLCRDHVRFIVKKCEDMRGDDATKEKERELLFNCALYHLSSTSKYLVPGLPNFEMIIAGYVPHPPPDAPSSLEEVSRRRSSSAAVHDTKDDSHAVEEEFDKWFDDEEKEEEGESEDMVTSQDDGEEERANGWTVENHLHRETEFVKKREHKIEKLRTKIEAVEMSESTFAPSLNESFYKSKRIPDNISESAKQAIRQSATARKAEEEKEKEVPKKKKVVRKPKGPTKYAFLTTSFSDGKIPFTEDEIVEYFRIWMEQLTGEVPSVKNGPRGVWEIPKADQDIFERKVLSAMNITEITAQRRLFVAFDTFNRTNKGIVDFYGFLQLMYPLVHGSFADCLRFCFYVYDVEGTKTLRKQDVYKVLMALANVDKLERVLFAVQVSFQKIGGGGAQIAYEDWILNASKEPVLINIIRNLFIYTSDTDRSSKLDEELQRIHEQKFLRS